MNLFQILPYNQFQLDKRRFKKESRTIDLIKFSSSINYNINISLNRITINPAPSLVSQVQENLTKSLGEG